MLSEFKILLENIRHFRQLITEGVSDQTIVDAINDHKYLYIYYKGDNTVETGYRTIRPFVLGVNTSGNLAVRAWQDKGRSDSLRPDSPRNRLGHEHHTDTDGKTKAGWRLFLVDNISSAYPTGVKFNDKNGQVMIPPGYKEHDADMTGGIIASISANPEREIQARNDSGMTATQQKVPRYEKFKNANINNRKITKKDVLGLYDIATRVMKKSINRFFVSIDDQNYYYLQDKNIKPKFPQNAIVGDLDALYDKYVRKPTIGQPEKDKYFKQEIDKLAKDTAQKEMEKDTNQPMMKENEKFPITRKTFFKT